jgi:outer membrane immunogenic protein
LNFGLVPPNPPTTSGTHTLTGWTVGTGAEFALTQNWSAKGEWTYFDLGDQRYNSLLDPSVIDTHGAAVRIGVNYHFNH